MEQFLRQLQTIPEAAELIRRVEEGGCPAAVSGLQPVQRACVGAAVAAACGRPAVFLCGDEREVQVLSADLETLTGRRPVTLLGREWQFRPGAVGSRDWERSRLAALYALAQGDAPVVVATADGLMARTLPPETLRSLAITLEVGGAGRAGRAGGATALRRVYPVRAGGGRGPVRPAGRHSGRVLSPDGPAGAVRVF